ncbi:Retrovirus-related Pol polyprotein from transposon opus [Gossypium australe]|uniref:Retrovirus-related Pol polyprotein from transposon opus n=1 Tax=Gossypium australe TaxID=47621 RepID=A0A5B6USZ1_9ROSI|nr:Retrovirus-related Pol polyprotein from transposon opus [Gossypium australe]
MPFYGERMVGFYTSNINKRIGEHFIIMSDASDYVVELVLGQKRNNIFYAVRYASKIMNLTQRNYTTTKK